MAAANPYTQALLPPSGPGREATLAFVAHWDALESLVLAVYRQGGSSPAEEAEWRELRAWLQRHYPERAAALAAHRPGGPAAPDPFLALLQAPDADAFAADRPGLARLPAAREALNRWLLAQAPGP
jgi:hypothetical protein